VFKSVLVTGGCGFIGANLVRELTTRGTTVRVLDNLSRGSRWNLCGVPAEIIKGDVRDAQTVSRALAGIEAVVHLAAYGSVTESVTGLAENFDVNVRGTVTMLAAAAEHGVGKFVFASSGGAVIGRAAPPVSEDSLPCPVSPYGASKLCGEAYCHAFAGSFGLRAVALRFANVYGPYSAHKRGAVTNFIKAILFDEPIVIYGDGSVTRDFIYVDDLCTGILESLDRDLPPGTVLHLASGVETTVGTLARMVCDAAGRAERPVRYEACRRGELERNFANFERARQILGFSPRVTLREGLRRTFEWFEAQDRSTLRAGLGDA
jgi:UDP-glucose 4-epimerase